LTGLNWLEYAPGTAGGSPQQLDLFALACRPQPRLEELLANAEGEIDRRLGTAGFDHRQPALVSTLGRESEELRLAETGCGLDQDRPTLAAAGSVEQPPNLPELGIALKQRIEPVASTACLHLSGAVFHLRPLDVFAKRLWWLHDDDRRRIVEALTMVGSGASLTVTIRFASDSKPMSGVVVAAGREMPFAGWMELAGLLESLASSCQAK
jgi:hypothetical protein